ncbi:hypothetical protein [Mucilaginibacter sp. SJ]|uniref:hypothetical protein n=1 Tax=Mucilaginibacter sp. SJ TaxID=3029053 RepID=UPI0023A930D7|nr:hypothetical protein [Mucilaginibacter sp. SJ]WEA01725.1 hypothetical protein MusilaSJ_02165 [Mucilaginibacter sp. SJ]
MKTTFILMPFFLLFSKMSGAQTYADDQSVRYQQQRMVYQQWDKNKFTPKAGFLSLNPYYWLTWGLFHPNYNKTDRRPLKPDGPQTIRLASVAAMSSIDDRYKLQSDTVRKTAESEIINQSGLLSAADPLWNLYYARELRPVTENNSNALMAGLSPAVAGQLLKEGVFDWYAAEVNSLHERLTAARSADMDRGSRIMAYHRMLMEYRKLSALWSARVAASGNTIRMTAQRQLSVSGGVNFSGWPPQRDREIAQEILLKVK